MIKDVVYRCIGMILMRVSSPADICQSQRQKAPSTIFSSVIIAVLSCSPAQELTAMASTDPFPLPREVLSSVYRGGFTQRKSIPTESGLNFLSHLAILSMKL